MADRRPAHRKGTTGHAYRKLQATIFKRTTCARCGNTKGPIMRIKGCPHPTHQQLAYCPTHPLAPSLGHKVDLQHGGKTTLANAQLEHYGCNASAGVKARMAKRRPGRDANQHSWAW